jgi:carbon storage regulator
MLVLSRKSMESICIGDEIVVTVLEVRGRRVQIGIEAPRQTSARRLELCQRSATAAEADPALAQPAAAWRANGCPSQEATP